MHELSIVDAIIDQVQQEVEQAGARGRVIRLELAIGHLSGVNPDSIRFGFELLSPGTVLDGAELRIRQPAAISACRDCGARIEIEELAIACPQCSSGEITIEGGRDLLLETIELEE